MHDANKRLPIYQKMLELITAEVNRLATLEEWDEEAFSLFESRWTDYRNQIENLPAPKDATLSIEEEKRLLEQIVTAHEQLTSYMQHKWDLIKSQVVSVKQNQSLVNAYYHINRVNDVSYYFDARQ